MFFYYITLEWHFPTKLLSMKNRIGYYSIFITAAFMLLLFSSYLPESKAAKAAETKDQALQSPNHTMANGVASVTAFDINKDFYFADERIPMEDHDVYERLDREILHIAYHHTSTILAIKRAQRVFPIIEPILAKHGLPDDLKYLAVTESSLANATSGAGAKGIWQFMKGTGAYYGLEINKEVDERNNLEKATEAACKYLKHYHKQFGSWPLAASAYNMGGPRLKKTIQKQKGKTLFDLNLNKETMRYFFRIIANKEIMQNPETYGYNIYPEQKYTDLPAYSDVVVDGAITNWAAFAKKHGMSYRQLKVYNPWIKGASLTNRKHKEYLVRVPLN